MVAVDAFDIEHASLASPPRALRRARVLVLARSYPNAGLPLLGLWTQRLAHCVSDLAEIKVVSPVPYMPPVPQRVQSAYLSKFRTPEAHRWDGEVEVFHPRMAVGPGYATRPAEAASYRMAVGPTVSGCAVASRSTSSTHTSGIPTAWLHACSLASSACRS